MSDDLKLDILRQEIQAGINQLEAGDYETFSEESVSNLVTRVRAKALRQKVADMSGEKSADADSEKKAR